MSSRDTDEITALGKRVAQDFTSDPRFTFVDFAGFGRHGGTFILSEKKTPDQTPRLIVIKYSYGELSPDKASNSDEHLRNEFKWLARLQGAEHIGQLVDLADCKLNIPGLSNGEKSQREYVEEKSGEGKVFSDRVRFCPTFAIEYLSGGTLYEFRRKLRAKGYSYIPNRLLWRIWLCMVRQCIAMAFPPDIPEEKYQEGHVEREVIKPGPYTSLTQNSPHEHNFMFDINGLPGREHEPNIPILKLIDFGRAKLESEEDARGYLTRNIDRFGSRINLRHAAYVFMPLCSIFAPESVHYEMLREPVLYTWKPDSHVLTRAPDILRYNTVIDPELRHILVRLFAGQLRDGPSLREVLQITEKAVNSDPAPLPPEAAELGMLDTDEEVQRIIQDTIYDVE